ncbi:hypothetical protein MPTK1_4g05320 [Marchantia polymorpha subsp. ruderalis]|uniref:Oxysterol-binding protein n=3 Tax=Marchantia polymorpha TaxID=3197 RepID=A0AAF6B6L3_MARPO|nr:hypothetical protein MARPO_0087s0057 [Marchantia polymorpha]BBN07647.1 hypothetical protein Mp_4g05320 [Marchantia polymorpha subsp. ruderalis]|eukprot:PTQ33624.1 hypothetical protein MARPO_0087s0057 [Marchantia polymorpha]
MGIEHISCAPTRQSSNGCAQVGLMPMITPPLSFDCKELYNADIKQTNFISRIFHILQGLRPGADLTSFQLPPHFNLPKSQLQCYAEMVYCCGQNLLEQCADGATPMERFLAVVRWHISTCRPAPFGKAPYNPILGETHHVTAGDLNVLIEQVSHHPPISALHATNQKKKIELSNWNRPVPKFIGTSVEVTIEGRNYLTLAEYGETYVMTPPKLNFRFLPPQVSEWTGDTTVTCVQTGLQATVTYKSRSLLSRGSNRVTGKVCKIDSSEILYSLNGSWDQTVTLEEKMTGKKSVLYDAKAALSNLKAPVIKNPQAVSPMESVEVWRKVTDGVWNQDWDMARKAKTTVEETQRDLRKQRATDGKAWKPKYFSKTSQDEWEWQLKGHPVPEGPIVLESK